MLAVLAGVTTLAVGACGGGTKSATATSRPSTTVTTGPTTTAYTFSGAGSERFCEIARGWNERVKKLVTGLIGRPDAAQLQQFVHDVVSAVNEAVAAAPAEIKGDFKITADAVSQYATALERAGYDPNKVAPDAAARLQAPDVRAAGERVSAYGRQVCRTG